MKNTNQLPNEKMNLFNPIIVAYTINSVGSLKKYNAAKLQAKKSINTLSIEDKNLFSEYVLNRIPASVCDYPQWIRKQLYRLSKKATSGIQ